MGALKEQRELPTGFKQLLIQFQGFLPRSKGVSATKAAEVAARGAISPREVCNRPENVHIAGSGKRFGDDAGRAGIRDLNGGPEDAQ